jgi:hypothetical protein
VGSEVAAKAPVPIERLASQLRVLRSVLGADSAPAARLCAESAVATARYDTLLGLAATMLDVVVPDGPVAVSHHQRAVAGSGYDPATRRRLEEALAPAGLDVRAGGSA